jgi:hypothetical protein
LKKKSYLVRRYYILIGKFAVKLFHNSLKAPRISSLVSIFAVAAGLVVGTPQASLANSRVSCTTNSTSFRIVLENQGNSTFLITANNSALSTTNNSTNAEQACSQLAARLERAINAQGLDQLMLVADPNGGICIVRSSRHGCRTQNRIISIPRGTPIDEFMSSILDISSDGFFEGDPGQHTARRYYVEIGQALTSLISE